GYDSAEPAQPAEVDGAHVAVAVVTGVGFGVAVVEAAAAVDVPAGGHHVHALGGAAGGDARGGVVAVAGAGSHEDAVGALAVERGRGRGGVGEIVEPARSRALEPTGGRLGQMVPATGL